MEEPRAVLDIPVTGCDLLGHPSWSSNLAAATIYLLHKRSFPILKRVAWIGMLVLGATNTACYPTHVGGLDLLRASAKDVSEALQVGNVTSVQLVDAYLARIDGNNVKGEEVFRSLSHYLYMNLWALGTDSENGTLGLGLRAFIETPPVDKVRAIAHRLDVERTNGQVRSSLHGVPILVKDSTWMRREQRVRDTNCLDFDTATELGMNTTAGSFVLLKDGGDRISRATFRYLDLSGQMAFL